MSHVPYTTTADILANALVNDSPEIMQFDQLDRATQRYIVKAQAQGYHPVSVRWAGGLFALMFCVPGASMPHPQQVIAAYLQCLQTSKVFPKGTNHD